MESWAVCYGQFSQDILSVLHKAYNTEMIIIIITAMIAGTYCRVLSQAGLFNKLVHFYLG